MKLIIPLLLVISQSFAQTSELPYQQIPDYPAKYTASGVAARLMDGLGFRYYWATEGLRVEDLSYRPNDDARTTMETLVHIYELSQVMLNSIHQVPTSSSQEPAMSFPELRKKTLENIKAVSDKLKNSKDKDLKKYKMVFVRESGTRELPFWNEINGPISDALWHVGQVVSFRRSSGNPFNSKANVLMGKFMQ